MMYNSTTAYPVLVFSLMCLFWTACSQNADVEQPVSIIPEPVETELKDGSFLLNNQTTIVADTSDQDVKNVARQLHDQIESAIGYPVELQDEESNGTGIANAIIIKKENGSESADKKEGYHLADDQNAITISSGSGSGLFYGMQTLLQLFPAHIYQTDYTLVPKDTEWKIPALEITDYPRFSYRGLHLDVGRHLFPVSFIKRYIDIMAMHKMNRFHWHLTEDQGWRIEIKKYPKLTEIGAWRDSTIVGHLRDEPAIYDGKRYGGFYTQEEVKEIVAYAKEKYITIVPEIEMPGHASSALAAYPELGCKPDFNYHVKTKWGISEDIYCPSVQTFSFLEDVLSEVMELFPSIYIHIGGDEAPKKQWEESDLAQQVIKREGLKDEHELQSYFITRMEKFLNENGRQIIGWDEILEGGLAPNATVMSWRGIEGGIKAAQQQHNVIMTPTSHLYLDYYQANPETEPLTIGGFTTLEKTYSYELIPEELTREEAKYIMGAQANVWTEYIKSPQKAWYMAYPRASALAEITWTPKEKRNWNGFWKRLQPHFNRLEILGIEAAEHYRGEIPELSK